MSTVRRGDTVGVRVVGALERLGERAVVTEENAELINLPERSQTRTQSRLRRDLQAEGVVFSEMGSAASARHTVVRLRLPSGAKSALEQLAARLQVSVSFRFAEAGSP